MSAQLHCGPGRKGDRVSPDIGRVVPSPVGDDGPAFAVHISSPGGTPPTPLSPDFLAKFLRCNRLRGGRRRNVLFGLRLWV